MLRGIGIAVILGAAAIGIYFGGQLFLPKGATDPLQHALDQIQTGLTYDKFLNLNSSQRDSLLKKMPQQTIDLIMDEAKKFPSRVSESMQDMISTISQSTQSITFSMQGEFEGLQGHDAKGKAKIISVGKIAFLRFENFEVTNGPDLHVYMTNGDDITSGIDLAKLKGSIGDQNYALNSVDTKTYNTVIIYSQTFHVYFAKAKLS